jgi:hypothetical protein
MPGHGLLMMFLIKNHKLKNSVLNSLLNKIGKNSKNNLEKHVNIMLLPWLNSKVKKNKKLNKLKLKKNNEMINSINLMYQ